MILDIEDLQTFVEVADAGGVSLAARRLGVSKSIVSRRLFRLEAERHALPVQKALRSQAAANSAVPRSVGLEKASRGPSNGRSARRNATAAF